MSMKSDRQKLLKSGCRVVEQVGFRGLTARAVAKEGAISTQPIYLVFDNMTELRDEVREYIFSLIRTNYFKENKTISSFLKNYTKFIQEHPELYLALFLDQKEIRLQAETFFHRLLKESLESQTDRVSEAGSSFLLSRITGMVASLIETNEIKNRPDMIEELLEKTVMHDLQTFQECMENRDE